MQNIKQSKIIIYGVGRLYGNIVKYSYGQDNYRLGHRGGIRPPDVR